MAVDGDHYNPCDVALAAANPISGPRCSYAPTSQMETAVPTPPAAAIVSPAPSDLPAPAPPTTHRFGVGSAFIKMFHGGVSEMMFFPGGYRVEDECVSQQWFDISAPSGQVHKVRMERYGAHRLVFTNGWAELMAREGVAQGDIGRFLRTGHLALSLTMNSGDGLEKQFVPRHLPSPGGGGQRRALVLVLPLR